jgi:hypothetical protein
MTATLLQTTPRRRALALAAPDVDIVVPVYNEQETLWRSVRRLHRFLSAEFPFSWRIVIADNASTDATPTVARALAMALDRVEVLRLERKGRGRALHAAWSASEARVVCYWTPTCRPTCARCCRSSRRCSPATATWRSERAWRAARAWPAGPSAS